eukprot:10703725-Ditylum_brightwellii.AAC.1
MSNVDTMTGQVPTDGATGTTITRIGAQYRQQSSSRKKKRRARGSTKKQTQQQQNTLRQFLAPALALEPNAEIEATADVNELHHNTTNTNDNNQIQYRSTDKADCQ